jgi:hypothetical protein
MGNAWETIAGRVVNPGAALTALTPNTADSFSVRSFQAGVLAFLDQMWAHEATPGVLRIRSPRLHDNVQNLRMTVPTASPRTLLPDPLFQPLYPQDVLTVELSGGGAETDVGVFQIYYTDLPGIAARFGSWDQVKPRVRNILTNEVDITGAATTGDWSAGTPMNTTFDLLKANVDYAVLGYETSASVAAVALRGPDTGNLRVGGPGTTEVIETKDWFIRQSNANGYPCIPIINAANKAGTLAFQCSASASATTNVGWVLAELAPAAGM